MPQLGVAAEAVVHPLPASGDPASSGCPQVDAMDRQTAQIARLADNLGRAIETVSPAVEAITNLDHAQKKLCSFVVKHRVKILLSVPVVLTTVGAISPSAAEALKSVLKVCGVS